MKRRGRGLEDANEVWSREVFDDLEDEGEGERVKVGGEGGRDYFGLRF
jgi:hypothetical protein